MLSGSGLIEKLSQRDW